VGVWMAEVWKQWRGQIVDNSFPLLQYLCGSDQCAVFLTSFKQQQAAIKLVPASSASATEPLKPWQAAAGLSHPHLLKLLHAGQWAKNGHSFHYAVTEFAEEDLSQILPQRALTAREARDMLRPVLGVLAYLHQNNFVHGHLKPSNILASGDQLKVSSDGLHTAGDLVRTASTPSVYLAPEVDNQGLSPASDVWSLGVVLVEALTQRAPVWDEKQQDPKVPASLPDPFREITENCLRRDPAQRWTIDQIQAFLNPTAPAVPKRAVASTETPHAPAKRRFTLPLIAGAAVVIAVLFAAKFAGHPSASEAGTTPTTVTQARPSEQPPTSEKAAVVPPAPAVTPTVEKPSGSSSGAVVKQVVPDVPRSARNTIQGTVRVSVLASVDPSGNVSATRFENHGPSAYFANLAMKAAKDWKFKSPELDGREVASNWTLHFDFRRSGTNVRSERKPR
jgi:TonB family protein